MVANLYKILLIPNITKRLLTAFILLQVGYYEPTFIEWTMGMILIYIDQTYKQTGSNGEYHGEFFGWRALANACFFHILSYIKEEPTTQYVARKDRTQVIASLLKAYTNYTGDQLSYDELKTTEMQEAQDYNFFKKPSKILQPVVIKGISNALAYFDSPIRRTRPSENDEGILVGIHLRATLQLIALREQIDSLQKMYLEQREFLSVQNDGASELSDGTTTEQNFSTTSSSPLQLRFSPQPYSPSLRLEPINRAASSFKPRIDSPRPTDINPNNSRKKTSPTRLLPLSLTSQPLNNIREDGRIDTPRPSKAASKLRDTINNAAARNSPLEAQEEETTDNNETF